MKRRHLNLAAASSVAALGMGIGFPKRARASVTQAQADTLKTTLTPMGAIRAGNADGSIPAWTGGLSSADIPAGWQNPQLMPDLFESEQPIVTINASNMDQYADRLPDSVKEMMKLVGFSIVVYPTHRTASAPQWVYDYIYQNALNVQPDPGGARLGFTGAYGGIPFPILSEDPMEAGAEVINNHNLRWNGQHQMYINTTYIMAHGQLTDVLMDNYAATYPYYVPGGNPNSFGTETVRGMYDPIAPPNAVGADVIADSSINPVQHPNSGWELLTGQGRVRRIPEIQYDVPDSNIDGITNYDEAFGFLGALNEFDWRLVGKREMYIPYNNNRVYMMNRPDWTPSFLSPSLVRWELHRVWVVEATLHPGERNVIPRRRFYVDEDTWCIGVVDEYDAQNNFWKMTNLFQTAEPQIPGTILGAYVTYNVQAQSYAASFCPDMDLPVSKRTQDFLTVPPPADFNPQAMAAQASF